MNKYDTIAYYEALGDDKALICIDSTDSETAVIEKINQRLDTESQNTLDIEIFHNDNNIRSYKLIPSAGKQSFDLWSDMEKQIDRKSISIVAKYIVENMPKTAKSPYDKYVSTINADGSYTIKSFSDPAYEHKLDPKTVGSDILEDHILGQYRYADGHIEWHAVNLSDDKSVFDKYVNMITSDHIRLFAKTCLMLIPEYVYEVPASNDSENRQASDLADGGLKRHILNSLDMLLKLTELDYAKIKFTRHEIDMMIVACLFHDFLKSGWQDEYTKCSATKFDHPRIEARALRCVTDIIPANDLLFITNCIESHNGQFNIDPDDCDCIPLPIPDTECKYTVHLAVYLAKHKDIMFTNHEYLYVYKDNVVKTINSYIPISDANIITLTNAMDVAIDPNLAKTFDIHRNEKEIKAMWSDMIKTRRTVDRNIKYIDLANKLMFS